MKPVSGIGLRARQWFVVLFAFVVVGAGRDACIATPVLVGDYDGNGVVDPLDAVLWKTLLGTFDFTADGDGNGIVDSVDYMLILVNMGNSELGNEPDPTPADLIYDTATGDVTLDQTNANGGIITAFFLQAGPLVTGVANFPYETPVVSSPFSVPTEVDTSSQIAQIDVNVAGLPSTQYLLGPILPANLTPLELQNALSGSFYMAEFGGPSSFNLVILGVAVPEPASLTAVFVLGVFQSFRWRPRRERD